MTNQTDRIRRNTTYSVVERIRAIHQHPDTRVERLEIIELTSGVRLVTGRHYRVGDRGVYLRPGCLIPGWLAEQLWLVGKKRALAWFEVRSIPIGILDGPKVESPGLWCGEWYRDDKTEESLDKAVQMMKDGATVDGEGFIHWIFWREEWKEGFCLDGHLGIVEAVEQEAVSGKHNPLFTRRGHRGEHITRRLQSAQEDVRDLDR